VEAINLFSMFSPQLIHHDMKADNAVVLGSFEEGYKVKLIDFGCFVRATPHNKYSQSIGDPDYMPPEHSVNSKAFDDPPSSFDIYGIGLIHLELLCPALQAEEWSPARQMTPMMMMRGQKAVLSMSTVRHALQRRCPELFTLGDISSDLDLIEKLTKHSASQRLLPSTALEHDAMSTTFDAATPLEFANGDRVEYFSSSKGKWYPCVICKADTTAGTYDLCEEDKFSYKMLRQSVDPSRVRAEAKIDSQPLGLDESWNMPVVALVFKAGDKVEYHSRTLGKWYTCVVATVSYSEDGSGTYDLVTESGKPFKNHVPPERVRDLPIPVGTRVVIYGNLPGTIVEYDSDADTYKVLKSGTADTFYTNVSLDFIELQ